MKFADVMGKVLWNHAWVDWLVRGLVVHWEGAPQAVAVVGHHAKIIHAVGNLGVKLRRWGA